MVEIFTENSLRLKVVNNVGKKLNLTCFPAFCTLMGIYWLGIGVYLEGRKAMPSTDRLEDC